MFLNFLVVALVVGAHGTVRAQCASDCNGDGFVTIDELLTGVRIALESLPLDVCKAADQDGSGRVTINEIFAAVNAALTARLTIGSCERPGQEQSLIPCAKGTVVRAFACEDKDSLNRCSQKPPNPQADPPASRRLTSTTTDEYGDFKLGDCGASPLLLDAEVEQATFTLYRTFIAGPPGPRATGPAADLGRGADEAQGIKISPTSEAAVQLLAEVKGNFDPHGISDLVTAVNAANINTDFTGLNVAAAAEAATFTASSNPDVLGTIRGNLLSFSSITGQFFATADAQSFTATPSSPVAFQRDFPIIDFDPPTGTVLCTNSTGVDPCTRPFKNVVPQPDGSCTVQIAQGNGMQAGCGSGTYPACGTPTCDQPSGTLFSFNAVFTGSLKVGKPGWVAFTLWSDDGWILGFGTTPGGDQPTYVSGPLEGAPPASPFSGLQVVGATNAIAHGTEIDELVVHFPAAGTYPFELDYNESYGGALTLTLSASYAPVAVINPPFGTALKPACVTLPLDIEWEINQRTDQNGVLQVYSNDAIIYPLGDVHQESRPGFQPQLPLEVGNVYEVKVWVSGTNFNASTWVIVRDHC